MLDVFVNVLLPVFLAMGVGILADRLLALDILTISRIVFYIFSPALAFSSISTSALESRDLLDIGAFCVANVLIMAALGWAIGRALHFDKSRQIALLLTICFVNCGNYGVPVNLFAFGQEGMARAVVYFTFNSLTINTLGVYMVSLGHNGAKAALSNIFKMPITYASVLGIAFNLAGWTVPGPLYKMTSMLGDAAVPGMLIILGVQLSRTRITGRIGGVALATFLRMAVAPAVALLAAPLFSLTGVTRQVCILEASMPTAVMSSILALEFQADAEFVAGVIFSSTLTSLLSLSLLISHIA